MPSFCNFAVILIKLFSFKPMVKIFTLLLLLCSGTMFAQNVGIGIDSPTNRLHISAEADPVRIRGLQPGSSTDSVVTIDSTGVLKIRSGAFTVSLTGWSVTGNAGTTNANFLGTTDNRPLLIRTNNQPSAFIDPVATSRNNAFGNRSFTNTVTGTGNNAFGYQALSSLTTGSSNTALGDSAGFAVTIGTDNVAIGSRALSTVGAAVSNVAIGSNALKNSAGSENTAIGRDAALNNISGTNLLAVGAYALSNNQITNTQIAIGNYSLLRLTGGVENVAIGFNSALNTTTASYNVLLGHYTLGSASTSSRNTMVGHNTGLSYTGTGNSENTFIGYQAGLTQTGGTGNTYVGANVDIAGNPSVSNSSALGQAVMITASNQVRVGNTNVTSIGGQVGWTTFSDARIKKNIREDVPGMAFIEKLRPVTYNYDAAALQKIQGGKQLSAANNTAFESTRFTGLIAQEVAAAAEKLGYNFSGVDKPTNEQSVYGLRYAELVVPLIKAMQEMKQLIDAQQQEINELKGLLKK